MTIQRTSEQAAGPVARTRRLLLGAIAAGALAVGGLATALTVPGAPPAFAQTQQLPGVQAPAPGAPPPITVPPSVAKPFSFADVIDRVKPAVVSVKIRSMSANDRFESRDFGPDLPPGHPMERFRERFGFNDRFGPGGPPRPPQQRRGFITGQGSGFFISADGYVVTNYHVVDGAREVDVVTDDGKSYVATVIGTDRRTDLALLKVKGDAEFPYVQLATQAPRVGDWVLAVGNPFGLGGTVTAGIVSARGRDIGSGVQDDFLQIDAAVNRGNSGGPTFDVEGNVVGINTAIFSPSGGNVGIAFAIPASTVARVVTALKDGGVVERGFLGVETRPVGDEAQNLGLSDSRGALVVSAVREAPAGKAGMRVGDVIRSVNGEAVRDGRDLARRIGDLKPGTAIEIVVWRDGKDVKLNVEVGKRPADRFDDQPPPRRG